MLLLVLLPYAYGAWLYTETFFGSAAGWTNSGQLAVAHSNDMLVGLFAAQSTPMPDTGALRATNVSSGGAFVGNYVEAGIWLLGFSFMAADVVPSACAIRWYGPTSSFFRSIAAHITQTGVWYQFAFSLTSKADGGWIGGTEESFQASLTNVVGIQIELLRNNTGMQRYYLDNVFVARLPEGEIRAGEHTLLDWTHLRSNYIYRVQTADALDGTWETADIWLATNITHS